MATVVNPESSLTIATSRFGEAAELLAAFRENDVIPAINLAATIASALYPPNESEPRRDEVQWSEAERAWDSRVESAMIKDELPFLNSVTLTAVSLKSGDWLGHTCVAAVDAIAWLRSCGSNAVANRLSAFLDRLPSTNNSEMLRSRPLSRLEYQLKEIERIVRSLGYDPKALPKSAPGKPGIRNRVRVIVIQNPQFTPNIFKKAWQTFLRLS